MTKKLNICNIRDIPENTCKGFALEKNNTEQTIFIINKEHQFYAYKNFCPHTGAPLNWQDDVYMDLDNNHIQCSVHGALFEAKSGRCIWGPCVNQSLLSVTIEINNGKISITQPD